MEWLEGWKKTLEMYFLVECEGFECVWGFGCYLRWKENAKGFQRDKHAHIYISESSFDSKIKDKH